MTTLIPLHMGGHGFFFPMLFPLLLLGLLLFVLVRKGRLGPVRFAPGRPGHPGHPGFGRPSAEDEALARLAERLANGDITPEEYLERSSVLRGSQPHGPNGPTGTAGSTGKE
ncbi:SHOCT domain-containing protein [Propioniciclava coleopterorum]|nr:SHOCT domain-containing protein [Propioniciclava coleopterorum]